MVQTSKKLLAASLPEMSRLVDWLRAEPRARFLSGRDELLMILLPIAGAILTVGHWVMYRLGHELMVTDLMNLLNALILMDGIHVVFTFVMLSRLPELRQWSVAPRVEARGPGFWARTALVTVALVALISFLKLSPAASSIRGVALVWLVMDAFGPGQHTLAQVRGISFCYNSTIRRAFPLNEAEKTRAARCERLDRHLYTLLFWGKMAFFVPMLFASDHMPLPGSGFLRLFGEATVVMTVTALLINSYYFPRQHETRKLAYCLRLLLYPLHMLSLVGVLALRAMHGTEYFFIMRRMVAGSQAPAKSKRRTFALCAGAVVAWALPFCLIYPGAWRTLGWDEPRYLVTGAVVFTATIRYLHYYLDAVMFRMSDPLTRATMAPLLVSEPPEPGAVPRLAPVQAFGPEGIGHNPAPAIEGATQPAA